MNSPRPMSHTSTWGGSTAAAVFAVLAAATPLLTGCEDSYESREAAFPQPVGATIRPSAPPEQVADAQMPPPPQPQPWFEPSPQGQADPPGQAGQPGQPDDSYADTDPSALQDFRGALNPYGNWVDDPTYGTVWVPSASVVGNDFTPYVSAGHWAYDQDDYTWVSDYDWGWAPFHYGRWVYAGPTGWGWIPGRRYAGAWVSWRYGVGDWGYVGWAPLAPTWGWRGGAAFGYGFTPRMPYSFCASGELFAPHVGASIVTGPQVGAIGANTRPWTGSSGASGRVAAMPAVGGPPPSVLHIPVSSVVGAVGSNRGVTQARAFARPSTAVPLGGSSVRYASRSVTPAYAASSHFGGRLGAGFTGSAAASAPRYASPRPYYGSGRYSSAAPQGSYAGRGYSGNGGFSAYRGPVSPGTAGGGGGGFHAGGGGGGFRSGGGFHGGGGGPSGGRR